MGAEKRRRQAAAAARAEAAKAAKAAKAAGASPGTAAAQLAKAAVQPAAPVASVVTSGGEVGGRAPAVSPAPSATQPFAVGSNWKRLLERRPTIAPKTAALKAQAAGDGAAAENVVALDCEMVGVGPNGTRSVLARLSIVDHEGRVLIDAFVRPNERIVDYRTHITGISAATLQGGKVLGEAAAQKRAVELLEGKVVVGHAVQHDFEVLLYSHPESLTRDTALYRPLRPEGREKKTPSLAHLTEVWLHETIRKDGKHDSVEDARMALRLYRLKSRLWEKTLRKEADSRARGSAGASAGGGGPRPASAGAQVVEKKKKKKRLAGPDVVREDSVRLMKRKRQASVLAEREDKEARAAKRRSS